MESAPFPTFPNKGFGFVPERERMSSPRKRERMNSPRKRERMSSARKRERGITMGPSY